MVSLVPLKETPVTTALDHSGQNVEARSACSGHRSAVRQSQHFKLLICAQPADLFF